MTELNAGEALIRSGIDVDAVRQVVPRVEPYAVPIRVAPNWFSRLWSTGIAAVATPWAVYVREPVHARIVAAAEPERTGVLVVHELVHLDQFARLGAVRHIAQYLGDYVRGRLARLSHWDSYRSVRLEVEAREIASRFAPAEGPR